MGVTNFDQLDAETGRIKLVASLPTTPAGYYGDGSTETLEQRVSSTEWRGGEVCYLTSDNRIYIQQSTTGVTASWRRLLTQFATSTTSSSTSTSTSSSSSSSSSSTSSSSTTTAS